MPEHDVDKRHAPEPPALRFSARVRVLYFSKGQPRAVDADCQNISAEGLFVKTRRRGPDTGTPVSLILSFNDSEKEIMVDGIVRWQGEVQPLDDGTETASSCRDGHPVHRHEFHGAGYARAKPAEAIARSESLVTKRQRRVNARLAPRRKIARLPDKRRRRDVRVRAGHLADASGQKHPRRTDAGLTRDFRRDVVHPFRRALDRDR